MPEIERIDDAYIDAVIKASEVYDPNLDVTQGARLRELIKLMRDRMEQQGDLSQYQTKLSFDDIPMADSNNPVTSAGIKAYADQIGMDVKGSVQPEGETLKKLYDLIVSSLVEVTVETIAERDAYDVTNLPLHIFVKNDGDGNWALYKALTTGVNAQYVKLSDPDTLNSVMNASQIKASYESNPDTNALTNSLLQKLNDLNKVSLLDRQNQTGTQLSSTISDFVTASLATKLTGLISSGGVISSSDTILTAFGKMHYFTTITMQFYLQLSNYYIDRWRSPLREDGLVRAGTLSNPDLGGGIAYISGAIYNYQQQTYNIAGNGFIVPARPTKAGNKVITVVGVNPNNQYLTWYKSSEESTNPVEPSVDPGIIKLTTFIRDATNGDTHIDADLANIVGSSVNATAKTYVKRDSDGNVHGAGIVMTAPNGNKWRLKVSNDGQLLTQQY